MNNNNPIISDDQITEISEKYGIRIDPDSAIQYKLCQIIVMLEKQVEELKSEKPSE